MNKLHSKFASVVILAILLFSLNSMGAANNVAPRGPVENYQQFEIYAGRNNSLVGNVEIWADEQFTYVRYSTIPGWFLVQTNLHLGMNLSDIPQNDIGEPLPNLFAYQAQHHLVNVYTFQIPHTEWRYGAAFSILINRNGQREIGWAHKRLITRNNNPNPGRLLDWYFENIN
jgi:hypothetical protein